MGFITDDSRNKYENNLRLNTGDSTLMRIYKRDSLYAKFPNNLFCIGYATQRLHWT